MGKARTCRNLWMCVALLLGLMTSCSVPVQDASDWNLTPEQQDSLRFLAQHHYVTNDNFLMVADSMRLYRDLLSDEHETVVNHDELVVADYSLLVDADSLTTVWIQVARDQQTIGWVEESEFLHSVVPVNLVSRFIYHFSRWRSVLVLLLILLAATFYGIRKSRHRPALKTSIKGIDLFYPIVLTDVVACSATLYGSLQRFAPELWKHYYFHPTLNPFDGPLALSLFIASVWLIVLLVLAMIDQLKNQTDIATFLFCLTGTGCACLLIYLFFSIGSYYYVGYPFLILYGYASWNVLQTARGSYLCGACGKRIPSKGVCPYCGAMNE